MLDLYFLALDVITLGLLAFSECGKLPPANKKAAELSPSQAASLL